MRALSAPEEFAIGGTQVCELVPGLFGSSPSIRRVADQVRRHARARQSLLIQGESGTGKDIVGRAVHALSSRTGQYVPISAGCLPESLADAELFGSSRGAFTGSIERGGAFEAAEDGSLFIDEIADLPPLVQTKLLRVIEDGFVRRVGSMRHRQLNVRVISASHQDLVHAIRGKSFRADLYYRLATITITMPSLRSRRGDIAQLAAVLLQRMREDVGERSIAACALQRLQEHDWPGNVRELQSALYRAAASTDRVEVLASDLDLVAAVQPIRVNRASPEQARKILAAHVGNVSKAAKAAGVPRSTFRSWLGRTSAEAAQ